MRNVTLLVMTVTAAVLFVTGRPASALELEPGATFDGGICWEQDGTEGISSFDGQCITPADYDEIFSWENLSQVPVLSPDDDRSVAEVYGITPDSPKASERVRVFQGVSLGTFAEYVSNAHQVAL